MFWHATSYSARRKQRAFKRYVKEKDATTIQIGKLAVYIFNKKVFVWKETLLIAALETANLIGATEKRLREITKPGRTFSFTKSGFETGAIAENFFAERGSGIWFVHATPFAEFRETLQRHGMEPRKNDCMEIWAERTKKKKSLVAISKGDSILIVGANKKDVQRLGLSLGITRHPEKLERPARLPWGVAHRRETDPLLA
jgi:hypothetical protein